MRPKPKKSLSQNFLVDKNVQRKIIAACQLQPADTVLEIGAGRGELTGLIAERVNEVFAVEIDAGLSKGLKDKFRDYHRVEIINQDILKLNLKKYFRGLKGKIKIIGNIPYGITTPIIEHLFKFKAGIGAIFITVQKEFARRIAAAAGAKDYGSFSCFVRYYAKVKPVFDIKKTCFFPMPKVDSSLLSFKLGLEPAVKVKNEKLFFRIIRAAFNKRRKTLRNSLEGVVAQKKLKAFFLKYGLNPDTRPECLTLEDFANLSNL